MKLRKRRASDLGPRLWPGAEIETDPDVVERYEEAPDLPGPIQAVGPAGGPVAEAWCPQCQEAINEMFQDNIIAVSPITVETPRIMWPGHQTIASLITLTPCGHAFRAVDGQTIAEVREPAA
ncbi:hypothetical protein SAMN05216483_6780 [Streptomyces sp. 2131.1]|uniref:hypothetical protein n=1 Tax=Streptomyces sp. 2131.1 TaxID=1855346 RepID=UPI000894368F|nr:hypothetical protein [Streptomyces sp. 2131.1]SEE84942.1 hypothetical protein SAMN05216483_6780 [Streptomyces sp. 2131.1]